MINPRPGATIYEQLAADLRRQISTGTLRSGKVVPSERTLAQQHGIGRHTAARAIKLLRSEGLLEYRRGKGVFVREDTSREDLQPLPGSSAVIRIPSSTERGELGIDDGIAIIAVTRPDGTVDLYPADRCRLRW